MQQMAFTLKMIKAMNEQTIVEKEFSKLAKLQEQLKILTDQKKCSEAFSLLHDYCYSHYDFDDNLLIRNPETDVIYHLYDQKKLTLTQIEVIMTSLNHKAEIFLECGEKLLSELFTNAAEKLSIFIQSKDNNKSTEV